MSRKVLNKALSRHGSSIVVYVNNPRTFTTCALAKTHKLPFPSIVNA